MTAPTLAQLLPAARSGVAVAMEQLLRLTRPDIRRYALRHCAATTATDDVVQEALIIVYRRMGALREVATFVSERLSTLNGVLSTGTHFMLKTYKQDGVLMDGEKLDDRLQVSP